MTNKRLTNDEKKWLLSKESGELTITSAAKKLGVRRYEVKKLMRKEWLKLNKQKRLE